jgi:hypothetical protein
LKNTPKEANMRLPPNPREDGRGGSTWARMEHHAKQTFLGRVKRLATQEFSYG